VAQVRVLPGAPRTFPVGEVICPPETSLLTSEVSAPPRPRVPSGRQPGPLPRLPAGATGNDWLMALIAWEAAWNAFCALRGTDERRVDNDVGQVVARLSVECASAGNQLEFARAV
jgi:hypothetical protein